MRKTFSHMRRRLVSAGQSLEARSGPVIWIESLPGLKDVDLIESIMAHGSEDLRTGFTRGRDRRRPSTGKALPKTSWTRH